MKYNDGLSEIEKWVDGFEGSYSISNEGEVYSYKRSGGKKLLKGGFTCQINDEGKIPSYKIVCLSNNNEQYMRYVHRLVAEAFITNPENKPQVNHIDGDKQNNHVSNLEWVTVKENVRHAYDTGLFINRINMQEDIDRYIQTGENIMNGAYITSKMTEEDYIRNGLPKELINISFFSKNNRSIKEEWLHRVKIYDMIYAGVGTREISILTGVHESRVSRMKNGKADVELVKIYKKYLT